MAYTHEGSVLSCLLIAAYLTLAEYLTLTPLYNAQDLDETPFQVCVPWGKTTLIASNDIDLCDVGLW